LRLAVGGSSGGRSGFADGGTEQAGHKWDPPSPRDSTELAECPTARQALWDS